MNAKLTNPCTQVTIVTCRDLRASMKPTFGQCIRLRVINDNRSASPSPARVGIIAAVLVSMFVALM